MGSDGGETEGLIVDKEKTSCYIECADGKFVGHCTATGKEIECKSDVSWAGFETLVCSSDGKVKTVKCLGTKT